MEIITNKIIWLVDNDSENSYDKIVYSSTKDKRVEIIYNDSLQIINTKEWESQIYTTIGKSLFPNDKVDPILFKNVDEKTMIVVEVRKNHLLYNTTFSHEVFDKDVLYSKNHDGLIYIFSLFEKPFLKMAPSICFDHNGIITKLKSYYFNNKLRKKVIDLIDSDLEFDLTITTPGSTLNEPSQTNDLEVRMTEFQTSVKYLGNKYPLRTTPRLQETFYILKHKINTNNEKEILRHYKTIRNGKALDSKTTYLDVLQSMEKNFRRVYKDSKEYEIKKNISESESFSKFLKDSIKISPSSCSIKCLLPKNFNSNLDEVQFVS